MKSKQTFQSLAGKLLIASPAIRDGIFFRSVIYLTEHTQSGATGFIVNQNCRRRVGELVNDSQLSPLAAVETFTGGPVEEKRLVFASIQRRARNFHLELASSAPQAAALVNQPQSDVRAFIGYSGWTKGQLEHELQRKTWYVSEAHSAALEKQPNIDAWQAVLRALSPYHAIIAEMPNEPYAN